jgi:hypothetical protein
MSNDTPKKPKDAAASSPTSSKGLTPDDFLTDSSGRLVKYPRMKMSPTSDESVVITAISDRNQRQR